MTPDHSHRNAFVRLLEAADPRANKLVRAIELFGGLILIVTLIYGYRNLPVSLPVVINVALLVLLFITLTSALQVIRDESARHDQNKVEFDSQLAHLKKEAGTQKAAAEGYYQELQKTHPELRRAAQAEIEALLMGLVSLSADAEAYLTLLPERVFKVLVNHAYFKIKLVRITLVEQTSSGETTEIRPRLHSESHAALHYTFEPSGSDAPNVQAHDAVQVAIGKGQTACRDEQHCAPGTADPFWRIVTGFRVADDLPWYVFTFNILGNAGDHERERDYIHSSLEKQLATALKLAYDRGNMIQLTEALAQKTSANNVLEQRLNHAQKVKVDVSLGVWSDPEENRGDNKDNDGSSPIITVADLVNITPEEYAEFESDPAKLVQLEDNSLFFMLPVWKSRLPEPEVNGSLLNRKALESEWRKRARAQPGNGQHNLLLIDVPPQILRDSEARPDFIAQVEKDLRRCARAFHRGQSFEYDPGRYIIIGYDVEDDDTVDLVLQEAERLSRNLTHIVHAAEEAGEPQTPVRVGVYRCREDTLSQRSFQDAVMQAKLAWQSAVQDQKPAAIEVDTVPETTDSEGTTESVTP